MKKQFFLCFCLIGLLSITKISRAQMGSWLWAKSAGGSATTMDNRDIAVSTDGDGNSYVIGVFSGSFVFPASPAPITLVSAGSTDIFIAKYDVSGNLLWAHRAGGTGDDNGSAIKYDGYENIYVAGSYREAANFGPFMLNSIPSSVNLFIGKCNIASGDFLWVKQGQGEDYYYRAALDIDVDSQGDAYITGQIGGLTTTFAPLAPLDAANRWWDIFVVKYNGAGVPQWVTSAGSADAGYNMESGNGIAVDQSGNVYVTGRFNGTPSLPTYFGNIPLISNGGGGFWESDYFLAKYNQNTSSWEWAVNGGGNFFDYYNSNNDAGTEVSLDGTGNPYVNGTFQGTATFGTTVITGAAYHSYFVAKYSPTGNLAWVHPTGGIGYNGGNSSKVDVNGNLFFAGTFDGTTTVGSETVASSGLDNSYIASWNTNGEFQWVKKIPGDYYAPIYAMDLESNGNINVVGIFAGTQTFDCTTLISESSSNLAIAKLGTGSPTITCPAAMTVTATSLTGAVVYYPTPVGTDECGSPITVQTAGNPSGSIFPMGTTTNSFVVTDADGNTSSCSFTVTVTNPYCENNPNKVYVCHHGLTICISLSALESHLAHGDYLGTCSSNLIGGRQSITEITDKRFNMTIFPNPSSSSFSVSMEINNTSNQGQLKITNVNGQLIETRSIIKGQVIQIGENYKPGLYFAELLQGTERKTIKLVMLAN